MSLKDNARMLGSIKTKKKTEASRRNAAKATRARQAAVEFNPQKAHPAPQRKTKG